MVGTSFIEYKLPFPTSNPKMAFLQGSILAFDSDWS